MQEQGFRLLNCGRKGLGTLGAPAVSTVAAFVEVGHRTHNEGLGARERAEQSSPTPGERLSGGTGLTCRQPPT